MSLFKRLFGRNKKEEVQQEVVSEERNHETQEAEVVSESIESQVNEAHEEAEEETEEENEILNDVQTYVEEKSQQEETPIEEESNVLEAETLVEASQEHLMTSIEKSIEEVEETPVEETDKAQVELEEKAEEAFENEQVVEEKVEEIEEAPKKQGFIKRLFSGLSKTRDQILKGVDDVLSNFKHIDEDLYEELEEALIMADFGVDTTLHIMDLLKEKVKADKISDPVALKPALQEIITRFLTDQPVESILNPDGPTVILVIGVNGVGKTTSIGKMSHLFKSQGKKVLVAAADTFRAAAIEQLNVWTDRAGVELIKHEEGSDAAAVVFDAIAAAKSRKSDVLICDTAGRLQNKTNLMKELEKISRIISREYPEAKREILIAIDANTGQNALQQVKLFKEVADISGIILTKLDGTAKGGAIVGIYESLKVPVKYVGVGEKMDDLQPFDAEAFAKALFETEAE